MFYPPGISFIPREVGEHLVSIKKNGRHVANSPISIMVVQSEIGNASKVKAFGPGLVEGRTFQMADFIVDTRDAGEKRTNFLKLSFSNIVFCFVSDLQCFSNPERILFCAVSG